MGMNCLNVRSVQNNYLISKCSTDDQELTSDIWGKKNFFGLASHDDDTIHSRDI